MVSQRVSQSTKISSRKADTVERRVEGEAAAFCPELSNQTGALSSPGETNFQTFESHQLAEARPITENATQRIAATHVGTASNSRTRRSSDASTAPTPNSQGEVSGMPRIGNGCIFKSETPSGRTVWKVDVTVGYDFRGKRKRVRRTAPSLAEARILHRRMLIDLERGELGKARTETVAEYSEWWLENVKAIRVRVSTLSDYRDRLHRNVFPAFGHRRLGEISARDIEEWLASLVRQGKSTSTINGAKQVLGAVLGHAYRHGRIQSNPASLVSRIPRREDAPTQVQEPWTKQEAIDALRASQGTPVDLFIHLALIFGLRRGEILGLRWGDFDFENAVLSIRRTLKEQRILNSDGTAKVEVQTDAPKTKSSIRKLHLTPIVLSSVQRHRALQSEQKASAGALWVESGNVFTSSLGTNIHPSNFGRQYRKFLAEQGIRQIRIHDMRHSAAVLGLEAGVRLEAVSQGLGHSRIDITKAVYAPYVQPLMEEFTRGISTYLAPCPLAELGSSHSELVES